MAIFFAKKRHISTVQRIIVTFLTSENGILKRRSHEMVAHIFYPKAFVEIYCLHLKDNRSVKCYRAIITFSIFGGGGRLRFPFKEAPPWLGEML